MIPFSKCVPDKTCVSGAGIWVLRRRNTILKRGRVRIDSTAPVCYSTGEITACADRKGECAMMKYSEVLEA